MIILDNGYKMPPFSRIQWASKDVKDKYEPMWEKAKRFFVKMEKLSVMHHLRDATTGSISPSDFLHSQRSLLDSGLHFLPFQKVGNYSGTASSHPVVEQGKPWHYYGAITRDIETAKQFLDFNDGVGNDGKTDHYGIGNLLGYPSCCVEHFNNVFVEQQIEDTTWHRALNTSDKHVKYKDDNKIVLQNIPWQTNNIFKSFHNMAIFHMPCSFDCKKTLSVAKSWFNLAESLDLEGLRELEIFLRLPYEWNCFKGIAYIKTPLFKMSVNSNFSTERFVVQVEGTYFPLDAPRGLEFPWDNQTRMKTLMKEDNTLTYWGKEDDNHETN